MRPRVNFFPFLVLVLCLLSAFFVARFTEKNLDQRAKARFDSQRKSIQLRIQKRLDLYISVLYSSRALFAASREVDRAEWSAFMRSQNLTQSYPGLAAIEYIEKVPAGMKDAFEIAVRADTSLGYGGYPDFAVYPPEERDEYYVVNYVYPFEENRLLFGLNIASDPARRDALEAARDGGGVRFTQKLFLRQGGKLGFLIFMPVYRNHFPVRTLEERRIALRGFVASEVNAEKLFRDLYDDYSGYKDIDFEIFDGEILTKEHLLYDSNESFFTDETSRPRFGVRVPFHVPGQLWTLRFTALPEFQLDENEKYLRATVRVAGALISFLIFGVLYFQSTSRLRAVKLAEGMTADLKKLSQVQSEFTSTVSHELRTPLAVIKESLAMLGDGTTGKVNEEQKDLIETARNNVERLTRLINAVLDYQKLDSHSMKFHWTTNDVNEFVREVVKGFAPVAKAKGLELRAEFGDIPPAVFDRDRLTQVLVNLVDNAIKFTEKGAIRVRTSLEGKMVRVLVEDQGMGIRAEDLPKLFKSFSQTGDGHKKTGGTGLGLAISKKIVEAHQGAIGVESVYGHGAGFYFTFPLSPQ